MLKYVERIDNKKFILFVFALNFRKPATDDQIKPVLRLLLRRLWGCGRYARRVIAAHFSASAEILYHKDTNNIQVAKTFCTLFPGIAVFAKHNELKGKGISQTAVYVFLSR